LSNASAAAGNVRRLAAGVLLHGLLHSHRCDQHNEPRHARGSLLGPDQRGQTHLPPGDVGRALSIFRIRESARFSKMASIRKGKPPSGKPRGSMTGMLSTDISTRLKNVPEQQNVVGPLVQHLFDISWTLDQIGLEKQEWRVKPTRIQLEI